LGIQRRDAVVVGGGQIKCLGASGGDGGTQFSEAARLLGQAFRRSPGYKFSYGFSRQERSFLNV
jgi:hypothetical protein